MRKRVTRILAALMILSMVVVPFQSAMATDDPQASPVSEPDTTEVVTPATPEGDEEDAEAAEGEKLAAPSSVSALSTTPVTVESIVPTNNGGDNFDVVVTIVLEEGFARLNGQYFTFSGSNYPWESNVTFLGVTMGSTSLPVEIQTTPSPTMNSIVVVATGDFTVPAGGATLQLTLELDVEFLEGCRTSPSEYHEIAEFYGYVLVDGVYGDTLWASPDITAETPCPASAAPWVDWMRFEPEEQVLEVDAAFPVPLVPGQSVTISYDATRLTGPVAPVALQMYNEQTDQMDTVGEAVASNGVLTFTITASGGEGVYEGWVYAEIPMTFVQACQEGQTSIEIGELEFVAVNNPDDVEDDVYTTEYIDRILCEADPITKSGVWMTDDNDQPYIQWTIDSGNLLPRAYVYDYAGDRGWTFEFDCTSVQVTPAEGTIVSEPWPGSCENWQEINFALDQAPDSEVDYVRAVITVNAYPVEEPWSTSFVNCAYSETTSGNDEFRALAAPVTGLGGEACFELFPEDGGDFITKDVDKAEVLTGETITYTVVAETTADRWSSVEVTDELPAGFVIDESSITCTIEPAVFSATPCYELNDGVDGKVLSALAIPGIDEEEGEEYDYTDAVKITLTFKGTVTAPAGSTIVNEACSIREMEQRQQPAVLRESMGDPTIVGGGEICDDAVTRVVAPPATETPTPTATATATPSPTATTPATPGASPTITVDPTATVGVTELPKTGTEGSSSSAFQFMAMALVASVVVAALGIRAAETRK